MRTFSVSLALNDASATTPFSADARRCRTQSDHASGSSPRVLPASVLPTPPALAFGGFRVSLAEQGSEFFQQPTSFILIGCALQFLSQSIEACDDFVERSLSDHREMGNVEDVRILSIIGYPTSCTTFVPFPSPMNISCLGRVFARLPVRKRCEAQNLQVRTDPKSASARLFQEQAGVCFSLPFVSLALVDWHNLLRAASKRGDMIASRLRKNGLRDLDSLQSQ